jgi:hypothetical protein
MTLAYTYAKARGTGGDLFSLDYINVDAYPKHRTQFDERHRIVLSGIVGLPWDMNFSTLLTLGTGRGFTIVNGDFFGPGLSQVLLYTGRQPGIFPYESWDLQLQKDFLFGPARFGLRASVFNVTNHMNVDPGSIDGFIPKNGTNANFGTGNALLTDPRRLQVGVILGFLRHIFGVDRGASRPTAGGARRTGEVRPPVSCAGSVLFDPARSRAPSVFAFLPADERRRESASPDRRATADARGRSTDELFLDALERQTFQWFWDPRTR